jgi:hypothetical protein
MGMRIETTAPSFCPEAHTKNRNIKHKKQYLRSV